MQLRVEHCDVVCSYVELQSAFQAAQRDYQANMAALQQQLATCQREVQTAKEREVALNNSLITYRGALQDMQEHRDAETARAEALSQPLSDSQGE